MLQAGVLVVFFRVVEVAVDEDECGGGLCQGGSSGYPAGIGVCVGGPDDACSDP